MSSGAGLGRNDCPDRLAIPFRAVLRARSGAARHGVRELVTILPVVGDEGEAAGHSDLQHPPRFVADGAVREAAGLGVCDQGLRTRLRAVHHRAVLPLEHRRVASRPEPERPVVVFHARRRDDLREAARTLRQAERDGAFRKPVVHRDRRAIVTVPDVGPQYTSRRAGSGARRFLRRAVAARRHGDTADHDQANRQGAWRIHAGHPFTRRVRGGPTASRRRQTGSACRSPFEST